MDEKRSKFVRLVNFLMVFF
uniref:Cyclic nucleotide-gated ion channel 1-like n=1 Tax=Rhizophora mucronata TaxID=61149 RepID=A0A2P2JGG0_RHIMU